MACGIGEAAMRRAVSHANERIVFDVRSAPTRQSPTRSRGAHATQRRRADLARGGVALRPGSRPRRAAHTAEYLAAEASWFAADQVLGLPRSY